jgi:hypothetical protein
MLFVYVCLRVDRQPALLVINDKSNHHANHAQQGSRLDTAPCNADFAYFLINSKIMCSKLWQGTKRHRCPHASLPVAWDLLRLFKLIAQAGAMQCQTGLTMWLTQINQSL